MRWQNIACIFLYITHTYSPTAFAQAPANEEQLCLAGSATHCHDFALSLAETTPPDYTRAAFFYQKACDPKYQGSCLNLANLYRNGNGVAKNAQKAKTLYEQVCRHNEALGCSLLAREYLEAKTENSVGQAIELVEPFA